MPNLNMNLSTANSAGTNDLTPTMQIYYDKKLLETIKPKLVHGQFGQKRPIPRNGGKTIKFRKWTPFEANTTALTEGTPPDGQYLNMTDMSASIAQYGGYVSITDLLDMTALDPVVNDAVEMMGDQGALTLDRLVRETLHAGTNVMYAAKDGTVAASRAALTAAHKLTTLEIRRAVRTLKKAKAPMFSEGGKAHYIAIVGPDTTFDLQSDSLWQAVGTYQSAEKIYSGEIGRLFGVRFIETTEAKIFEAADYIYGTTATLTTAASSAYDSSTKELTLSSVLDSAAKTAIAGKKIVLNGELAEVVSAAANASPETATVLTLKAVLASATAADYNGLTVYPAGGGKTANDVASTLILGKDAYGLIDIAGSGAVKSIIKSRGSAGTADPLNQVSTVGWKVPAFTSAILQQTWMLRIEHGFTA